MSEKKTAREIYKEALVEIIEYLGEPFSSTSDKVTQIAREALSAVEVGDDDDSGPTDFVPGDSPPSNPEQAEEHYKELMEHLLEKSGVPAVHYLAGAVKHLLASAYALGKMNDEHAGRLNWYEKRVEKLEKENSWPRATMQARIEKLEHEARAFQPWQIGESPVGLLNRIEALEDLPRKIVQGEIILDVELRKRVAALEEIIEVVPPERRPSFRIQKLEDTRVELKQRLDKLEKENNERLEEIEDTHTQDFDTLRVRGDVHHERITKLEESPGLYKSEHFSQHGALSELVNMFIHARGPGALPEGELKEVLKSFKRRLLHPSEPKPGKASSFLAQAVRSDHWPTSPDAFVELDTRPKIVVLCGSTRFARNFADANLAETLKGNIVLTVGSMTHADDGVEACIRCRATDRDEPCVKGYAMHQFERLTSTWHADTKKALDELHKKKIEMADEVFVLNVIHCAKCHGYRGDAKVRGADGCEHDMKPYIGESTKSEIKHAYKLGKRLRFLNPLPFHEDYKELWGYTDAAHDITESKR